MGAREILESTYCGVMNVYHYPQKEEDGITSIGDRTLLYRDEKCALSQTAKDKTNPAKGIAELNYTSVLFCAPDLEIPAGCEIEIAQDGMQYQFRNTGEAFKYVSHQEIMLERVSYA